MYPYENILLKKLKGEIWKDIPAYEGYYMVSSLGRVKSLDRIIPHPRLGYQPVKGRMLKQKIIKDYNKHTGDAMISLQVALALENIIHYYNVRRLVYTAFKRKINFKTDGLYVINKDSDGYNNRVSNLKLVPKTEKQRRSINNGRQDFEYLKTIDRSGWKKNYSRRIPVSQYSAKGKLVRKYKSIREAHEITGFDSKEISNAAKGLYNGCWRGYRWKFDRLPVNTYNKRSRTA
jgi:NUMOD4 motif/NUMOD1 domain